MFISTRMSKSLVLFSSDDEESESNYEAKQYDNFSALLKGVPPPSSVTVSKFTVDDMLQRFKENENCSGFFRESQTSSNNNCSKKNPIYFINYLNASHLSESLSSLVAKVQQRYIQLETMSSCNIWFQSVLQGTGSAKKRLRLRHGMGLSPGRRLSHLARRRQFFSSANLQKLASTDSIRQIEIKKTETFHAEHNKPNRAIAFDRLNSSKRALFLSPESGTPTKYGNVVNIERKIPSSSSEERSKGPLQENSKRVEVSKWLSQQNFDVDFPRKRLRDECTNHSFERKRKCPRRSLNFAEEEIVKSPKVDVPPVNRNSLNKNSFISLTRLSQNHKNKLLWAVSVVLKEKNITRNDENFKVCASTLFHRCRKNLDDILSLSIAGGTSDKMLKYARDNISLVFEELGIQCPNEECNLKNKCGNSPDFKESSKSDRIQMNVHAEDDAKENINENFERHLNDSTSDRLQTEFNCVFKTPRKILKKRTVKSCQKTLSKSIEKKRKRFFRRWHSLESLLGLDVSDSESSRVNRGNGFVNETITEAVNGVTFINSNTKENFHVNSKHSNLSRNQNSFYNYGRIENNLIQRDFTLHFEGDRTSPKNTERNDLSIHGFSNDFENILPQSPESTTVPHFSPIPSSVQDEDGIPKTLFPALCSNSIVEKGLNSSDSLTDSSKELLNLDFEAEHELKGFITVQNSSDTSFNEKFECTGIINSSSYGSVDEEINVSFNAVQEKVNDSVLKITNSSSNSHDTNVNVNFGEDLLNKNENILMNQVDETSQLSCTMPDTSLLMNDDFSEESIILKQDIGISDEIEDWLCNDSSTNVKKEDMVEVIGGKYKPRKLVVKKSKPNWKVVKPNSEENDSETELKLKMRLSHEWEVVCRNSSCSESGRYSEYEASSIDCSQISNTCDEKDSFSEFEPDSSRHASFQLTYTNYNAKRSIAEDDKTYSKEIKDIGDTNVNEIGKNSSEEVEFDINGLDLKTNETLFSKICKQSIQNLENSSQNTSWMDFENAGSSNETLQEVSDQTYATDQLIPSKTTNHTSFPKKLLTEKISAQESRVIAKSDSFVCDREEKGSAAQECKSPENIKHNILMIEKNNSESNPSNEKLNTREQDETSGKVFSDSSLEVNTVLSAETSIRSEEQSSSDSVEKEEYGFKDSHTLFVSPTICKTGPKECKRSNLQVGETNLDCTGAEDSCSSYGGKEGLLPIDSESDKNSITSNDSLGKKKCLSLENYKARKKLTEKTVEHKLSSDNEDSDNMFESKNQPAMKVYAIRLKHPVDKSKYKDYYRDKYRNRKKHRSKSKHKHKRRDTFQVCEDPDSDVVFVNCRQKPEIKACKISRSSEKYIRSDHSMQERSENNRNLGETMKTCMSAFNPSPDRENTNNGKKKNPVSVQTIVNALSTLSNLVEQQIKRENEEMMSKSECTISEKEVEKSRKNDWMELVSSWCGKNLTGLKSQMGVSQNGDEDKFKIKREVGCSSYTSDMKKEFSSARDNHMNSNTQLLSTPSIVSSVDSTTQEYVLKQENTVDWKLSERSSEPKQSGSISECGIEKPSSSYPSLAGSSGGAPPEERFLSAGSGTIPVGPKVHGYCGSDNKVWWNSYSQKTDVYSSGNTYHVYGNPSVYQTCVGLNSGFLPSQSVFPPTTQPAFSLSNNYYGKPALGYFSSYQNYQSWQLPSDRSEWLYQHNVESFQNTNTFPYQMPNANSSYYYNNY